VSDFRPKIDGVQKQYRSELTRPEGERKQSISRWVVDKGGGRGVGTGCLWIIGGRSTVDFRAVRQYNLNANPNAQSEKRQEERCECTEYVRYVLEKMGG
jgi:hypothetical protein